MSPSRKTIGNKIYLINKNKPTNYKLHDIFCVTLYFSMKIYYTKHSYLKIANGNIQNTIYLYIHILNIVTFNFCVAFVTIR